MVHSMGMLYGFRTVNEFLLVTLKTSENITLIREAEAAGFSHISEQTYISHFSFNINLGAAANKQKTPLFQKCEVKHKTQPVFLLLGD